MRFVLINEIWQRNIFCLPKLFTRPYCNEKDTNETISFNFLINKWLVNVSLFCSKFVTEIYFRKSVQTQIKKGFSPKNIKLLVLPLHFLSFNYTSCLAFQFPTNYFVLWFLYTYVQNCVDFQTLSTFYDFSMKCSSERLEILLSF